MRLCIFLRVKPYIELKRNERNIRIMKELIKRAAALLAAAMMVVSVSSSAFAVLDATARPRSSASSSQSSSSSSDKSSSSSDEDSESSDKEGSSSDKESSSSDKESSSSSDKSSSSSDSDSTTSKSGTAKKVEEKEAETQPPVVTQAPAAPAANKSYTTKGGAFLWFLLSVIVNTIISFAVAKRFYKLAKQSNRVQAEIRALRHDIEEKFADSVNGFTEPAVDITNTNDDYSSSPDGIKMTPVSTTDGDGSETEDIYKQWEAQFGARHRQSRAAAEPQQSQPQQSEDYDNGEEDMAEDYEHQEEPRPSTKKYQPTRTVQRKTAAPRRNVKKEADESIGDKMKGIIGKLFPMDDDE